MQQFKEITQSNVDRFLSLREASIIDPKYKVGHMFQYKGGFAKSDFESIGVKEGDAVTKVGDTTPDVVWTSKGAEEDFEFEAFLQSENGKVIRLRSNSAGSGSGSFSLLKAAGAPPSGSQWEELIIVEYNKINNKQDASSKNIVETHAKFPKYWSDAKKVATNFNSKVGGKVLVHTGAGGIKSVSLGPIWKKEGAKNKTPKTDMANKDFSERISLKKEGGSRSASPAKAEAIAIVKAALALAGESDKAWATNLTTNMGEKMESLVSKETASSLKARYKKGERSADIKNWKKVEDANKELSKELQDVFQKDKKVGGLFARCVLYEASTGATKFGGKKQHAAANRLAKFNPSSGKVLYYPMEDHNAQIIASNAENLKPYVSFKKGGGGSAAYSAFQLSLKNEYTPTTATSIILSELNNIEGFSQFLTEEMLDEGVMDVIKKSGNWAKEMGQKAFNAFKKALEAAMKKIWSYLKKIVNLGKLFFTKLLEFFGIEIDKVVDKGGISADNFHLLN